MAHGGKRPGAGKKKGGKHKKTLEQRVIFEYLRARIIEEIDPFIEAKFELAKGIYVIRAVKDKDGQVVDAKVYQKKPDGASLEYLLNVAAGKPKEAIALSPEGAWAKEAEAKQKLSNEQRKRIHLAMKNLGLLS